MNRFKESRILKAKLLAWSEFNVAEIDSILLIYKSKSPFEIYSYLEKILDLNPSYFKSKILIDLHYYALKFAIDNEFSKIQISAFISILRALHKANQETPFENYELILNYFNQLMITHSIKRPPFCLDIFDTQTATKIITYITNSYLKNYKLFKYVFTPIVGFNLEIDYGLKRVQTPPQIEEIQLKTDDFMEDEIRAKTAESNDSKKLSAANSYYSEDQNHIDLRNYIKKLMLEHLETEDVKLKLEQLKAEKIEAISARVPSSVSKKKQ